jgi:hypothetical protein
VGLVDRLRRRSIYHGGGEWIYRLSEIGWRLLLDHDMTADGEDYTPRGSAAPHALPLQARPASVVVGDAQPS